jgi:hypothetical protein
MTPDDGSSSFYEFVLLIIFLCIWFLYSTTRSIRLRRAIKRFGFSYKRFANTSDIGDLLTFSLFKSGSFWGISYFIEGVLGNLHFRIFDYSLYQFFLRGFTQTVICIKSDGLKLPIFSLTKRTVFGKIWNWMQRNKDPLFERSNTFLNNYLITGSDREAIKLILTSQICDYFMKRNKFSCVELDGNKIIFYNMGHLFGKIVNPRRIPLIIQDLITLHNLLASKT